MCITGKKYPVAWLIPLYFEYSPFELHGDFRAAPLGDNSRHDGSASTAPACHGLATASLPHPHLNASFIDYFDKFHVRTLREQGIKFDHRANLLDFQLINVIGKNYRVRVPHGYKREGI